MKANQNLSLDYQNIDGGKVLMVNNMTCMITIIGNIKIKIFDRVVKELKQVRHAPNLKKNIVSLGMLENIGYSFEDENDSLKVIKGFLVIIKGERLE